MENDTRNDESGTQELDSRTRNEDRESEFSDYFKRYHAKRGNNGNTSGRGTERGDGNEETARILLKEKTPRGRKPKTVKDGVSSDQVNTVIVAGFTLLSGIRGDHFYKTEKECEPFSSALADLINSDNPKLAKKVKELSLPLAVATTGIALLVGPVIHEYEQFQRTRNNSQNRVTERIETNDAGYEGITANGKDLFSHLQHDQT